MAFLKHQFMVGDVVVIETLDLHRPESEPMVTTRPVGDTYALIDGLHRVAAFAGQQHPCVRCGTQKPGERQQFTDDPDALVCETCLMAL